MYIYIHIAFFVDDFDDEVEAEWVQDEAPDPRVFLKSINVPKNLK